MEVNDSDGTSSVPLVGTGAETIQEGKMEVDDSDGA